jgi:ankyrin repeat protein
MLDHASGHGNLPLVELLVKKGADIHHWNDMVLSSAVYGGHLDVVKFLVNNGADVQTLSYHRVSIDSIENVDILEFIQSCGWTPDADAADGVLE